MKRGLTKKCGITLGILSADSLKIRADRKARQRIGNLREKPSCAPKTATVFLKKTALSAYATISAVLTNLRTKSVCLLKK
ncbi:MAG: hypothetical protein L6V93_16850 [Clostridiales bacterium]|nr:MAG: hypothetical protein L6V93_16850 [Clostridiales bacterium]